MTRVRQCDSNPHQINCKGRIQQEAILKAGTRDAYNYLTSRVAQVNGADKRTGSGDGDDTGEIRGSQQLRQVFSTAVNQPRA